MSYRFREAEGRVDVICDDCGDVLTSAGDGTLLEDQIRRAGWTLDRTPDADALFAQLPVRGGAADTDRHYCPAEVKGTR